MLKSKTQQRVRWYFSGVISLSALFGVVRCVFEAQRQLRKWKEESHCAILLSCTIYLNFLLNFTLQQIGSRYVDKSSLIIWQASTTLLVQTIGYYCHTASAFGILDSLNFQVFKENLY